MARTGYGAPSALLSLRENRTSFATCPDRLAQGTSCASRKPYPSPSGATHVVLEPLGYMYRMYGMPRAQGCAGAAMARPAALVPSPRVNLTRFHGVFALTSSTGLKSCRGARGAGWMPTSRWSASAQPSCEPRSAATYARSVSASSRSLLDTHMTFAPLDASSSAALRPMPRPAPVTSATRFSTPGLAVCSLLSSRRVKRGRWSHKFVTDSLCSTYSGQISGGCRSSPSSSLRRHHGRGHTSRSAARRAKSTSPRSGWSRGRP